MNVQKEKREWYCEAKEAAGDLLNSSLQKPRVDVNILGAKLTLHLHSCRMNDLHAGLSRGENDLHSEIKQEETGLSFAVLPQGGAVGHHNLLFLFCGFNQHSTVTMTNFF